jgi:hypothetical protein
MVSISLLRERFQFEQGQSLSAEGISKRVPNANVLSLQEISSLSAESGFGAPGYSAH